MDAERGRTPGTRDDDPLARILETTAAAFFSLDRDWRFTYVNAATARLLGRPPGEFLGRTLWEVYPHALGSEFEEGYRRALATGEPVTFEAHYPPPLDVWYEITAWPSADGLLVHCTDVSTRRAAQREALDAHRAAEAARSEARAERSRAEAAQRAAEETARRLDLVAAASADLAATLDTEEAVARLARLVVPDLAEWSIVSLTEDDSGSGRGMRDIGWWHVDPALRPVLEEYLPMRLPALSPAAPAKRALAGGARLVVRSGAGREIDEALESEEARELLRRLAPESGVFLPLRAGGRTLGLLSLYSGHPERHTTPAVVATATEVAARAGLALDNARMFSQQQRLAEGLQRSLLTAPPEPDHLQIVVRYSPAAAAAQVGGDWYDAFLQPGGATVLVIGDVMGHDVDAAAAMGQVRSLLRGIAYYSDEGPAAVLAGLDATMQGLAVETTATAVVARVERSGDGGTLLRWSSAGHPPPLLLTPAGDVEVLEPQDGPGLLLGIDPGAPRTDAVREVARGSTVLLYTDGLVERRDQGVDEGVALLRQAVADLAGATLDELCDGVLARLLPARREDDVALVAVRLHPEDRPRPPEAGPGHVPPTPRPHP